MMTILIMEILTHIIGQPNTLRYIFTGHVFLSNTFYFLLTLFWVEVLIYYTQTFLRIILLKNYLSFKNAIHPQWSMSIQSEGRSILKIQSMINIFNRKNCVQHKRKNIIIKLLNSSISVHL